MTPELQRLIDLRRRELAAAKELEKLPIMRTARERHLAKAREAQGKIEALVADRNAQKKAGNGPR